MHTDLFKQLNNALLDLQGANLQTFERPLKKISTLLNNPDLDAFNSSLKEPLIYSETQLLPPDKSRPPERCRDEKSNKSAPP
ncbi:hypothetical protein AL047_24680 [Pseudomonas syringae pv. broussonetiae]|nr:hypothetical protein AL047_24680 [Pseudomonas syringae pv. broussonetiae]